MERDPTQRLFLFFFSGETLDYFAFRFSARNRKSHHQKRGWTTQHEQKREHNKKKKKANMASSFALASSTCTARRLTSSSSSSATKRCALFFAKFSRLSFPFFDISLSHLFFLTLLLSLLLDTRTQIVVQTPTDPSRRRRFGRHRCGAGVVDAETGSVQRRFHQGTHNAFVCFFIFFFSFWIRSRDRLFFSFFGGKLWKKKKRKERETERLRLTFSQYSRSSLFPFF